MTDSYVIFGASKGGEKVYLTLQSIGVEIAFFVDNNKSKWGECLFGKHILSPDVLTDKKYPIIIAAEEYQEAIEQQLLQMRVADKVISKEKLLLPFIHSKLNSLFFSKPEHISNTPNIFIELLEGCPKGFGGMVHWSMMASKLLQDAGVSAHIVSSKAYGFPEGCESLFIPFEAEYNDFWGSVLKLTEFILRHLPCIIFSNKQLQMFYAAMIAKHFYPELVTLFSVIHSDLTVLYQRAVKMEPYVDLFLCTTQTNYFKLSEEYGLPEQKLSYKEMPVPDSFFVLHHSLGQKKPIKIGWGARLVKSLKRADLLIPLIHELEKTGLDYRFYIAGSGECFPLLEEYIRQTAFGEKITLLGQLKREEMPVFWSHMDCSVCLSEREGACLSLLESMACGAVPISTEFRTAKEVILPEINGLLIPQQDCKAAAASIAALSQNRQLLDHMSDAAIAAIQKNYTSQSYQAYLLSLIHRFHMS